MRSHDWSHVQAFDWRVPRSPTIVQDLPQLIVRRSYDYVRPLLDRYDLRSQQQVFDHVQYLFAADFDHETVHDQHDLSHDLSAILCDLATQLVVHRSQSGRTVARSIARL